MASISALVDQLKGLIKTNEDVDLLFNRLGTKDDLIDALECENIPDNGRFHVYPKELRVANERVACVTANLCVRMEKYKYRNPRIADIMKDEDDVNCWSKYTTNKLCVYEWQKYAIYSEGLFIHKYDEDEISDKWNHTGDHKDPSYDAFAEITVYLYFHLSSVENLENYKLGSRVLLYLIDLTGSIYDYNHVECKRCKTIGNCPDLCTGRIGEHDDGFYVECTKKRGKLVSDEESYTTLELQSMKFMILA